MTADTLHMSRGCYLKPLFSQSLKHFPVKWRLVLVFWSPTPTPHFPSWPTDPGPDVRNSPVLQVNHKRCSCMRVFNFVDILGVSEGIWSVKSSDWQTKKDNTRQENKLLQYWFNSWFSGFSLWPQALVCRELWRSKEQRGQKRVGQEWKHPNKKHSVNVLSH